MTDGGVLTFGESMALFVSGSIGPLSHARTAELRVGGAESNVAIGLRRLGVDARWIGRVGEDPLGDLVEQTIRSQGVEVHALRDPAPTGLMIKERRLPSGGRVLYYRSGSAGSRLEAADIPDALVESAALVHVTGITAALSSTARAAVTETVRLARRHGVPVSFDFNYRSRLWDSAAASDFYRSLVPHTDLVFAGADEAALVTGPGKEPAAMAEELGSLGPATAVIKLGSRGALAWQAGTVTHRAAIEITPVDTVGAGDAFVAGYLAEWLGGRPPEECLATAVATGAFACLASGDWEGAPTRDELAILQAEENIVR